MNVSIGDKIAICRKDLGLTQAELAAKLFMTRSAVAAWEQHSCIPRPSQLARLENALKFDVKEHLWQYLPKEDTLGGLIRLHRMRVGLTQIEAGAKLGVNGRAWGKLERGTWIPNLRRLVQICRIVHASPDVLLQWNKV